MPNATVSTEEKWFKKERVMKDISVSILMSQKTYQGAGEIT